MLSVEPYTYSAATENWARLPQSRKTFLLLSAPRLDCANKKPTVGSIAGTPPPVVCPETMMPDAEQLDDPVKSTTGFDVVTCRSAYNAIVPGHANRVKPLALVQLILPTEYMPGGKYTAVLLLSMPNPRTPAAFAAAIA